MGLNSGFKGLMPCAPQGVEGTWWWWW